MSILSDPFPSLLALRRRVSSPAPDLLQESAQRTEAAYLAARSELGASVVHFGAELPATTRLPDPYGPDPVVFGSVPRVAAG